MRSKKAMCKNSSMPAVHPFMALHREHETLAGLPAEQEQLVGRQCGEDGEGDQHGRNQYGKR